MIHQPLIYGDGIGGQVTDIEIEAREMEDTKTRLTDIIARHCNQPYEKVAADSERNHNMSAEEAKTYGLVDQIIDFKKAIPPFKP
jgi:ATP-dependent Clp protease protease subunit